MGLFNFFKGKKNDVLTSIFAIAEKGIYNTDIVTSQAGKFEIIMFDIWMGTMLVEEKKINIDYVSMQNRIEDFLKQTAKNLGLPIEKKYESIYLFRQEGWEHDIMGLIHSDYPRTKQFLPSYMYLCMIEKPLVVFDEETIEKEINKICIDKLVNFLDPFCKHYSWLVETIMNTIK